MNRHDLALIQAYQGYPAVTIISPTHRSIPDRQQDPTMLKNLVKEAKAKLTQELPQKQVQHLLDKLDALVADIDFSKTLDAIALFVSDTIAKSFMVPGTVQPHVNIDSTFFTKPLVRMLQRTVRYWVLSISEKPTRLFMGNGDGLVEILEPDNNSFGVPQNGFPFPYEGSDESAIMAIATGDRAGDYFDNHKKNYIRTIDELLSKFLAQDPLPVVLMGTEKNMTMFKELSNNNQRIMFTIEGDHARTTVENLSKLVWPQVDEYFTEQQKQKVENFKQSIGSLKHAFGAQAVWFAAQEGRVHELLVEKDFRILGQVDPENKMHLIFETEAESKDSYTDLVNIIIDDVISKGGAVSFVPNGLLKEYDRIAALLRY
ncbi:MAG: hypothetical protein UU47_C0018G0001 [candidate division TM6 bacterium GW2011_GWE2_41_16]|nr:MAG: hypothetical protein UU47_C0018G0001 [candidate division TM6 bacterium GW2011_GWE2_41_16]